MLAFQCDRCGTFSTKTDDMVKLEITRYHCISTLHLCPDCADLIQEILDNNSIQGG